MQPPHHSKPAKHPPAVSPRIPKGITFGTPAGSTDTSSFTLLATPTPGAANSEARPGTGPLIVSATHHLAQPPQAGEDIAINATVRSTGKGVSAVELLYRCGPGGAGLTAATPGTGS